MECLSLTIVFILTNSAFLTLKNQTFISFFEKVFQLNSIMEILQKPLRVFLPLIILLTTNTTFSQNNIKSLNGRVKSLSNDVANVLIINLNSKKSTSLCLIPALAKAFGRAFDGAVVNHSGS